MVLLRRRKIHGPCLQNVRPHLKICTLQAWPFCLNALLVRLQHSCYLMNSTVWSLINGWVK
jgi:hypothetical protein